MSGQWGRLSYFGSTDASSDSSETTESETSTDSDRFFGHSNYVPVQDQKGVRLPDSVVKGKEALNNELKYFVSFVFPEMEMKTLTPPQNVIDKIG